MFFSSGVFRTKGQKESSTDMVQFTLDCIVKVPLIIGHHVIEEVSQVQSVINKDDGKFVIVEEIVAPGRCSIIVQINKYILPFMLEYKSYFFNFRS